MGIEVEPVPDKVLKRVGQFFKQNGTFSLDSTVAGLIRPHRIYTADERILQRIYGLELANFAGWRYLLTDDIKYGRILGVVEISASNENGSDAFLYSIGERELAVKTEQAFERAEVLPIVEKGQFYPRVLRIPSIQSESLWLKNQKRGLDLIQPMCGIPDKLSQIFYYADDFVASLHETNWKK